MKNCKTIKVRKGKKSYTIKGLKSGKNYYVCIRPMKKKSGVTYTGILTLPRKVKVK